MFNNASGIEHSVCTPLRIEAYRWRRGGQSLFGWRGRERPLQVSFGYRSCPISRAYEHLSNTMRLLVHVLGIG